MRVKQKDDCFSWDGSLLKTSDVVGRAFKGVPYRNGAKALKICLEYIILFVYVLIFFHVFHIYEVSYLRCLLVKIKHISINFSY